jgi:hypothetical protein
LKHRKFFEMKNVEDSNGYCVDHVFVTELGERWLLDNQQELNLRLPKDEDIPF